LKLSVMSLLSKSPSRPNLWTPTHLAINPQKSLINHLKRRTNRQIINLDLVEDDSTAALDVVVEDSLLEVRELPKETNRINKKPLIPTEKEEEEEEVEVLDVISTIMPLALIKATLKPSHRTDPSSPITNKDKSRAKLPLKTNLRQLAPTVAAAQEEATEGEAASEVVTTEEEEEAVDVVVEGALELDTRTKMRLKAGI